MPLIRVSKKLSYAAGEPSYSYINSEIVVPAVITSMGGVYTIANKDIIDAYEAKGIFLQDKDYILKRGHSYIKIGEAVEVKERVVIYP